MLTLRITFILGLLYWSTAQRTALLSTCVFCLIITLLRAANNENRKILREITYLYSFLLHFFIIKKGETIVADVSAKTLPRISWEKKQLTIYLKLQEHWPLTSIRHFANSSILCKNLNHILEICALFSRSQTFQSLILKRSWSVVLQAFSWSSKGFIWTISTLSLIYFLTIKAHSTVFT